jgi:nitrite reductase/ring-hydroxylating ferredoxin subunit/uncharacterized membrane protein
VEDALNGVWLGHALHPAVTDIPLGAWTVAAALDAVEAATGRADFAPGADAAVAIGLAGAVGSAVTGLTQWYPLQGPPRKLGAAHALLNVTATTLFAASYVLRRGGNRGAGRLLGWLGLGVVSAGAYLGGALVYEQRLGVDHAPREGLPRDFVPVLAEANLPRDKPTRARAGEIPIVLVRPAGGGENFALAEPCSHLGGPLAKGTLEGDCIACPWHGSRFRLQDGSVAGGPATFPQPCFETRVRDGQIEVRAAPSLPQNRP